MVKSGLYFFESLFGIAFQIFVIWIILRRIFLILKEDDEKTSNSEKQNVDFSQFDNWYMQQNFTSEMKHIFRGRKKQNIIITRTTSCREKDDEFEGVAEGLGGCLAPGKNNLTYYLIHEANQEFYKQS